MFKKIISACLVCACLASAQALDNPVSHYANRIGLVYSNLSGYGVYYQRSFLKEYAVRATAFARYYEYILGPEDKPLESERNSYYNLGLDFQRNIINDNRYRVFAIAAAGYMEDNNKPRSADDEIQKTTIAEGVGFGAEFYFLIRCSSDISLLYSYDDSAEKHSVDPDRNNSITRRTKLGVSASVGVGF